MTRIWKAASIIAALCLTAVQMVTPSRAAPVEYVKVAFGTIAVVALCIGVCALADTVIRVVA